MTNADSQPGVNRAVVYAEPGTTKTEVVELPIPQPGPGEILVRLLYSGVCHTDYAFCTNSVLGAAPTPAGQIGGHEGIGKVLSQGPGVTTPPLGSFVGIKYAANACLACAHCLQGGETSCLDSENDSGQQKTSGYFYPGTFQQYVLAPAKYVTPIPAELVDDGDGKGDLLAGAAPLLCAGMSVYTALRRAGVKHGDWVVVSGAGGGLGHLAVQYARVLGARVVGVDGGKQGEEKGVLGAEVYLDYTAFASDEALAARVKEVTGGTGAQIVVMCAATARAYAAGLMWLGFRGKLCCLGFPRQEEEPALHLPVTAMIAMEWTVMANKAGHRLEAIEALEIAARYGIKTKYQLRKMEELTQIFEDMEDGKIHGRVVIDLR